MSDFLGKLHFWPSFIFINGVFMPMFLQGLAGANRRMYDGGAQYLHNQPILFWNEVISWSAWLLALSQIPFLLNFVGSLFFGKKVSDNPWEATTLEWTAAPSPPPHGNFPTAPVVYRDPYEYSVPGATKDFTPQNQSAEA